LKVTWQWLRKKANELSVEEVWEEFEKNPYVTITKEEDMLIKKSGQNSKGSFKSRYTNLGIQIISLDKTPKEIKKNAK
ncbi:hypothetical protein CL645_02070, partial [bacterium]|nr:hypothetical protein [bacterium]